MTERVEPSLGADVRLLPSMAESIQVAHASNPSSWSVNRIASGTLVLWVESVWVMALRETGGDLLLLGDPNDEAFADVRHAVAASDYAYFRGFSLVDLSPEELLDVHRNHRSAHEAVIADRANAVKTNTQRANEHNPELIDLLEHVLRIKLPRPKYDDPNGTSTPKKYRSRSQPVTGYWKLTADEDLWRQLQDRHEIISTLRNEPTEPLSAWPDDRPEFTRLAEQRENYSDGASHRLWMFAKGMQVGDKVVVHAGQKHILGVGTIESDYEYVEGRHRRSVSWTNTESMPIKRGLIAEATQGRNLWGLTPIERQSFDMIAKALGLKGYELTESTLKKRPSIGIISSRFASEGLAYTPAQIATFYTALQTKGFVVLSGISGTGKSKIAQNFVKMLPALQIGEVHDKPRPKNVMSFMTNRDQNWVAIPASQADLFPPVPVDYKHSVVFEFAGNSYTGFAVTKVLAFGKPTLYLTLGDELADKLRENSAQETVYATTSMARSGDRIETIRLSLDPRDLGGDHPRVDVGDDQAEPKNSLFLSVRPDWRDSTSLLGYYNPLTQSYEWTEFLRFVLRAAESFRKGDGLAWFVILDEMNLAHVEYYFADLLSVIESGRDSEGWSQEPIRLTYPDTLTDNSPPHEIRLPPNLYIIGTVNMDETTHAFSPKMLDRAFTIELTDVSFANYPPPPNEAEADLAEDKKQALLDWFTRGGRFAQIDKAEIREVVERHDEIREWLQELNTNLARHQFQFGYRVFDEIAQFVFNAEENRMFAGDSSDESELWVRAFDHAVFMKVLPKFTGSHARLHGPLTVLLEWAKYPSPTIGPVSGSVEGDDETGADGIPVKAPSPRLPRVYTRAEQMHQVLEANGFVSFG